MIMFQGSSIKVCRSPPCFSAIFTTGNNFYEFLFISLEDKTLPSESVILGEQTVSQKCWPPMRWAANTIEG